MFTSSLFPSLSLFFFFFHDPATTEIYTLSLHDALPILPSAHEGRYDFCPCCLRAQVFSFHPLKEATLIVRSEEHTSELQSHVNLVCRLLLEKKKTKRSTYTVRLTMVMFRAS